MRSRFLLVPALLALAPPAAAYDAEFEKLRAAARQHEAGRAKSQQPPTPAARPSGPSLAKFIPPAPKGWRMRGNPFDDADGLMDLTQQASTDYAFANGAKSPALEVTIMARGATIGGGAPKLGADKYTGDVISKVSVRDHAGYMAWNAASKQGKLSVSVGRHQILVAGRDVAPEALIALAASIDLAKLARL